MTLDEQIAIIQAVKDGKTVKMFHIAMDVCFGVCEKTHKFDFSEFRYEIQREPMEIWVNFYVNGFVGAHKTEACAKSQFSHHTVPGRTVKFREVLDE